MLLGKNISENDVLLRWEQVKKKLKEVNFIPYKQHVSNCEFEFHIQIKMEKSKVDKIEGKLCMGGIQLQILTFLKVIVILKPNNTKS